MIKVKTQKYLVTNTPFLSSYLIYDTNSAKYYSKTLIVLRLHGAFYCLG